MGQRPRDLLLRLDELLAANPCTPSYNADMNDEKYTAQHEQWHLRAAPQFNANINFVVRTACRIIDKNEIASKGSFRICSVGCGDGRMDTRIVTKIREEFPQLTIQYVGVDINEYSCKRARQLLQPLENVNAELIVSDMQTMDSMLTEPFDYIFIVQSLCYVSSVEKALSAAVKLLKPSGLLAIVSPPTNPLCELCVRFWLHEYKRVFQVTSSVTSALDNMEVTYTMETPADIGLDLTPCFKEEFKHPFHKVVLDFIAQTKMAQYPPTVFQVSVDYLRSIAQGKPDKYVINHAVNWLVVEHKCEQSSN